MPKRFQIIASLIMPSALLIGWIGLNAIDGLPTALAQDVSRPVSGTRIRPERSRPTATQIGKNHELVREAFGDIVKQANPSVVTIVSGTKRVSLGTVVSADGLLLTKSSLLTGTIACRVPNHGVVPARIMATDRETDLALLKVELDELTPASWANDPAALLGSWVSIPTGHGNTPRSVGVISARTHAVHRDPGVLGVHIEDTDQGLRVTRVLPGGAAASAEIKRGDFILRLNDDSVTSTSDLVKAIRKRRPNAHVSIQVRRDDRQLTFQTRLGRASDISTAEQGLLDHEGGPLSDRRSDFPLVIEHDCLIMPSQCGGPLIDIHGKVIGINIARSSRVSSYALPKTVVVAALKRMLNKIRDHPTEAQTVADRENPEKREDQAP